MKPHNLSTTLRRLAIRTYEACVPQRIRVGFHNRWFTRHSARWEKIRNTPDSVVSSVAPGVRMNLYGDSRLCEMLYFGGFETETRGFFEEFLRPGDTFLDIGANIGLYALVAAHIVGPRGHVHAFEPCSKTFERLTENVKLNRLRNVTCHRVALSHENAQAQLTLANGGFDAWNSLGTPYMGETTGSETVTTMTFDRFAREHGLASLNCAVKIDVEGWENQVLLGAQEFLSRSDAPVLLVEFTEEAAKLAGTFCSTLYRTLERLGYGLYTVSDRAEEVQPFPLCEDFPNVNLIASKDIAAVRARLSGKSAR